MKKITIGLIGNPNSGKTTVFNALTGARQHIGNWPGVTVERKSGNFTLADGTSVELVDLPGIYSLMASSEDERVAVEYALSGEANLFINVIDGTNLERNLYLSLLLSELHIPMLHVVTMMDIVKDRGITIDFDHLSQHLGCPVVGVDARRRSSIKELLQSIAAAAQKPQTPTVQIEYANEVEKEISAFEVKLEDVAAELNIQSRWAAIRLLESDPVICQKAHEMNAVLSSDQEAAKKRIIDVLKEYPDESFANSRYGVIQGLCQDVVSDTKKSVFFTKKVDKFILNRFLGIPFFLLVMYAVFWVTQVIGGAFIDFFDVLGGTLFVDGPTALMEKMGVHEIAVALIASGLGAGLQTIATFLPPIFFMFLCLSILEDSGYMARAAFVMDRFMRWLGLPGKSFVPMLVGFGCTVPAIMGTRVLESKRDRFLTIFMTPFMSCGAKLPVWVVFGAAFFPENPGKFVFLIYLSGIILGILTGLVLKKTLFQGEPSHFIMELPPYHMPRMKHIWLHSWDRLKIFIFRAGKVIVPMVLLLGVLNTIGTDGSIGKDDSKESLLSAVGMKLTPIFEPMGVEKDNWPATVSIFTGLFAKEAVVGTLNSLYGQNMSLEASVEEEHDHSAPGHTHAVLTPELLAAEDAAAAAEAEEEGFDFWGGIKEAFATIPASFEGIFGTLKDPLGFADVSGDEGAVAETFETETSVFANMRAQFSQGSHQAYAYVLFLLLYVPCLAALGAAFRELGKFYGTVFALYLTALGWIVATLYYQVTLGHQAVWIAVPIAMLAAMLGSFTIMGKKRKVDFA